MTISRNNPNDLHLVRQIDKPIRATDHYPVGWWDRFDDWCTRKSWWVQILICLGMGTVLAIGIVGGILFFGEVL